MRRSFMPKHTPIGKLLYLLGPVAIFLGLCMTNVITDIPLFEGRHKDLGIAIIILGVTSIIASNFFKVKKVHRT